MILIRSSVWSFLKIDKFRKILCQHVYIRYTNKIYVGNERDINGYVTNKQIHNWKKRTCLLKHAIKERHKPIKMVKLSLSMLHKNYTA